MNYDEFCEIFFDIPGFEGRYQINANQQIKSIGPRPGISYSKGMERIMKPTPNKQKYLGIQLFKNGKKHGCLVHRLMAIVFLPNPNKYPNVLHGDDNPNNNSLENLRWGTQLQNMRDALNNKRITETRIRGDKHKLAKLILNTETGIFYDSILEAAKYNNIPKSTLYKKMQGTRPNNTNLIFA